MDIVTGGWEADPAAGGNSKRKVRNVTYTRPISIPLPMSPKKCDVTEVHSVRFALASLASLLVAAEKLLSC